MKLEMMRHRSRLWRTFLSCLGATGPAPTLLLSIIEEGRVAIFNIGLGWRTLHCCDANSHSWRNRTKLPTRRHNTYSNSYEETRETIMHCLMQSTMKQDGWKRQDRLGCARISRYVDLWWLLPISQHLRSCSMAIAPRPNLCCPAKLPPSPRRYREKEREEPHHTTQTHTYTQQTHRQP